MSVKRFFVECGKAVGITVLFCLLSVLLFAFVIRLAALPGTVIAPVNRALQSVGIALGCLFGIGKEKGLWKGALSGVLSVALTYVIFSLLGSGFSFSRTLLVQLLFGALIGAVAGIIAVNIHK